MWKKAILSTDVSPEETYRGGNIRPVIAGCQRQQSLVAEQPASSELLSAQRSSLVFSMSTVKVAKLLCNVIAVAISKYSSATAEILGIGGPLYGGG